MRTLLLLPLLLISALCQAQAPAWLEEGLYGHGKGNVVAVVVAIILLGIGLWLWRMDRRIARLEKKKD